MAEPNQAPSIPTQSGQKSNVAEAARAVTRPILTIMFAGVIAQVVVEGLAAPDWFIYGLAMPCILSWFGERAVTRIREKK